MSVDDYTPVGNALIYTLKAGLGDDFDERTRDAWVKIYRTIAEVMRSAAYDDFDSASYTNTKTYPK